MIDRHALVVVNGLEGKCKGVCTRERITTEGVEKSVIDFFITCPSFYQFVMLMKIDEGRHFVVTRYEKKNWQSITVPSDNINSGAKLWFKNLNNGIKKTFKKI